MNLYTEACEIAKEALEQCEYDLDKAQDFIHDICESHEAAIYYYRGVEFCSQQDTSDGEAFLEDCGGIAQPGDTFGAIACRIAFATLYCAALEQLHELAEELEEAAQ